MPPIPGDDEAVIDPGLDVVAGDCEDAHPPMLR